MHICRGPAGWSASNSLIGRPRNDWELMHMLNRKGVLLSQSMHAAWIFIGGVCLSMKKCPPQMSWSVSPQPMLACLTPLLKMISALPIAPAQTAVAPFGRVLNVNACPPVTQLFSQQQQIANSNAQPGRNRNCLPKVKTFKIHCPTKPAYAFLIGQWPDLTRCVSSAVARLTRATGMNRRHVSFLTNIECLDIQ